MIVNVLWLRYIIDDEWENVEYSVECVGNYG